MSECALCLDLHSHLYWSPDGEEGYFDNQGTYINLCTYCAETLENRFGITLESPEEGP
ncbi:MAG: hypothetical protein ACOCTH_03040 [Halodesulfurarchaeum sp.]